MKNVDKINESIIKRLSDFDCLANSQVYGVAEPIIRSDEDSEEWIPVLVDNDGEDHYIFVVDDDYPMVLYHRLLSKSYVVDRKSKYGDDIGLSIQADMRLVCWGFRNMVKTTAEQIESFIFASLPSNVNPVKSNFDRLAVFNNEFKGIKFFLPEEVFLFSMDYNFKYTPNKRECVDLSNICNND